MICTNAAGDVGSPNPAVIRVDLLDGVVSVGSGSFPTGGGTFVLKSVGDCNGDGNSDLISQGNGTARVTFVNAAGTGTASTLFIADGGGAWQVVDVADVTGDGIDEILFVGTGAAAGIVRIANVASGSPVFSYLPTAGGIWAYAFAADLNGDGSQDLVFRGTGAAYGATRANRSGGTASVQYYAQAGGAFTLILAADLNGDGIDDLVDEPNPLSLGQVRVRTLDQNGNPAATGYLPNDLGSAQHDAGTDRLKVAGDFTNDGKQDLVYFTPGSFIVRPMDGITSAPPIFPPSGGGYWSLRHMGDTNADGFDDLIVTNAAGDVRVQLSSGTYLTVNGIAIPSDGLQLF